MPSSVYSLEIVRNHGLPSSFCGRRRNILWKTKRYIARNTKLRKKAKNKYWVNLILTSLHHYYPIKYCDFISKSECFKQNSLPMWKPNIIFACANIIHVCTIELVLHQDLSPSSSGLLPRSKDIQSHLCFLIVNDKICSALMLHLRFLYLCIPLTNRTFSKLDFGKLSPSCGVKLELQVWFNLQYFVFGTSTKHIIRMW